MLSVYLSMFIFTFLFLSVKKYQFVSLKDFVRHRMPFQYIFQNSFLPESKCGLTSALGKSHSLPGSKRHGTEVGVLFSVYPGVQ